MKAHLCLLATSLGICCSMGSAHANTIVVTFEDAATTPSSSPLYETGSLPDGYYGISGWDLAGEAWKFTDPSNNDGIGNSLFYGMDGWLSFDDAPVVFEGTYYKSYAAVDPDFLGGIDLYFQGQLVHSIADPMAPLGLEWIASGYSGQVDKIHVRGGLEGFGIDNLTYSSSSVTVPEPNAGLMMFTGLGLMGLVLQRRRVNGVSDK